MREKPSQDLSKKRSKAAKIGQWDGREAAAQPMEEGAAHMSKRIRYARERMRLPREEVAQKLGISPGSVQGYELSDVPQLLLRLEAMAKLLGVSVAWMVFGHGDPKPKSRKS